MPPGHRPFHRSLRPLLILLFPLLRGTGGSSDPRPRAASVNRLLSLHSHNHNHGIRGLTRNDNDVRVVTEGAIPGHTLVFTSHLEDMVNVASWQRDTRLGEALAREFTNEDLLVETNIFQGTEPLLALWVLLQGRCSSPSAYFCALEAFDGTDGSVDGPQARCVYTWPPGDLDLYLLGTTLHARALEARGEMLRGYRALAQCLERSAAWRAQGHAMVSLEEYEWAHATVVSRAIRFGDRGDRTTWSPLYLEPVGDLLNHDGARPTVCRFLNTAADHPTVQYFTEEEGLGAGQELTYAYGRLSEADAMLFYGFAPAEFRRGKEGGREHRVRVMKGKGAGETAASAVKIADLEAARARLKGLREDKGEGNGNSNRSRRAVMAERVVNEELRCWW